MILNNPLNWILMWNEWMNHILNRYLPFLMKSPLFCLFWTLFGQFSGTFLIRPVSKSPWLLNWIIFWIESADFFLNWIIFWIESWVKRYWIKYWMNHFLEKIKHWIESDRVSNTPNIRSGGGFSIKMPITSPTSCPLSSAHRVVAALRVSRDITTRRTPSVTTGVSGWQWEALYFLRMRTSGQRMFIRDHLNKDEKK